MIATLTFLGGLFGLLVAGHLVVDGASKIGERLGLTPMVIGVTIVAAGTSAPELAVVLQAVAADDTPLAVGSIIGSNIANILLLLGLTALFGTIHVSGRAVRFDIPVMIGASAALLVMSLDRQLSRVEGLTLFCGLVAFVARTLIAASKSDDAQVHERIAVDDASGADSPGALSVDLGAQWWPQVARLAVGIAGLAVAARYVISGAESLAVVLGIPELIVGLTIMALGTSAPEIVTTVIAALKGRRELAVGNAVGSNIFNILLVLGLSSAISPKGIPISDDAVTLDLPILLAVAVACLPFVFWDNRLNRWEGGVFVAYYIAYLIFLVLDGTGHRASDPFAVVMTGFVAPLTALTVGVVAIRYRRSRPAHAQSAHSESVEVTW